MNRSVAAVSLGCAAFLGASLASAQVPNQCGFMSSSQTGDEHPMFTDIQSSEASILADLGVTGYASEFGGTDLTNFNSAYRRILTGIELTKNYRAPSVVPAYDKLSEEISTIEPDSDCDPGMTYSFGTVSVSPVMPNNWYVWFRAQAFFHEARHGDGKIHFPFCAASDDPFHLACDPDWDYDGSYAYSVKFLREFIKKRPGDWAHPTRESARSRANGYLSRYFVIDPLFRIDTDEVPDAPPAWTFDAPMQVEYFPPEDQGPIIQKIELDLELDTANTEGNIGVRVLGMRLTLRSVYGTQGYALAPGSNVVVRGSFAQADVTLDAAQAGLDYGFVGLKLFWNFTNGDIPLSERVRFSAVVAELTPTGDTINPITIESTLPPPDPQDVIETSDDPQSASFTVGQRQTSWGGHSLLRAVGFRGSSSGLGFRDPKTRFNATYPFTKHVGLGAHQTVSRSTTCPDQMLAFGLVLGEDTDPATEIGFVPIGLRCVEESVLLSGADPTDYPLDLAAPTLETIVHPGFSELLVNEGKANTVGEILGLIDAVSPLDPELVACAPGYALAGVTVSEEPGGMPHRVTHLRCDKVSSLVSGADHEVIKISPPPLFIYPPDQNPEPAPWLFEPVALECRTGQLASGYLFSRPFNEIRSGMFALRCRDF